MARWRKHHRGTRFRIHAQVASLPPFGETDVVTIPLRPGRVAAGPRDRSVRTIEVRGKAPFHDEKTHLLLGDPELPPAARPLAAVRPRRGHFDHLAPGMRGFGAAHVYAVVRLVLDVWQQYLGRRIRWYFEDDAGRELFLFPHAASRNAWSGPGFLEFGWAVRRRRRGRIKSRAPFCENFDMIAHEVGHLILKDVVGNPPAHEKSTMYRAHEEAGADMVACVAALTLDRVLDSVLEETSGNLLTVNTLSRFAAWAPPASPVVDDETPTDPLDAMGAGGEDATEVRRFVHGITVAKVEALDDVDKHELSKPFSAAAYEVLARMFERRLVERRLIPRALAARAARPRISRAAARTPEFHRHFAPVPFRAALERARDDFGTLLARTWALGAPFGAGLGFPQSAANMLQADARLFGGAHAAIIRRAFLRRGIVPARPA